MCVGVGYVRIIELGAQEVLYVASIVAPGTAGLASIDQNMSMLLATKDFKLCYLVCSCHPAQTALQQKQIQVRCQTCALMLNIDHAAFPKPFAHRPYPILFPSSWP